MRRHLLRSVQTFAWLVLAFAVVANSTHEHLHTHAASHAGAESRDTSGRASSNASTNPDSSLASDTNHQEHSTQVAFEFGICGLCRSFQNPWLLSGTLRPDVTRSDLGRFPDELPKRLTSLEFTRLNPPRGPPNSLPQGCLQAWSRTERT